jgi:predicted neuraminidase
MNKKLDPLSQRIHDTVTNPDMMTRKCKEHIFYTKRFGDETMIVFATKSREKTDKNKYFIRCADYLVNPKDKNEQAHDHT